MVDIIMKHLLTFGILLLTSAFCSAEINTELSKMLYAIPAAPGMQMDRNEDSFKAPISSEIEETVKQIVFRNKEETDVPALSIIAFYDSYLIPKGFKKWGKADSLSSRYQAPSLVTKGNAYIWSQGQISYHVPQSGNFIVFWIEQRREFRVGDSAATIEKLEGIFSKVSNQSKFEYITPESIEVSDWDDYIENECFVDRVITTIKYGEPTPGCVGDDGAYMFYFSVFPTHAHAVQWRNRIIDEIKQKIPTPNYLKDGLALPPTVIDNIVVEYKGKGWDIANVKLKEQLNGALDLLANQYKSQEPALKNR